MKKVLLSVLCVLAAFSLLSCGRAKIYWLSIQADTAYNQGNAGKAIALYKEIIALDPGNVNAQWYLGLSCFSKGDRLGALKQVLQLKKLKRDDLADELSRLLEQRIQYD